MSEEKTTDHTHSSVDIRTITAPILTLISIAGMIIWATTSVWEQKQQLKDEIRVELRQYHDEFEENRKQLDGTIRQYNDLLHQLEDTILIMKYRQRFLLENMWTKKEHAIWCREMERQHKEFRCPDEDLKRSGLIGSEKYIGPVDRDRETILENIEKEKGKRIFNETLPRHGDSDYYRRKEK